MMESKNRSISRRFKPRFFFIVGIVVLALLYLGYSYLSGSSSIKNQLSSLGGFLGAKQQVSSYRLYVSNDTLTAVVNRTEYFGNYQIIYYRLLGAVNLTIEPLDPYNNSIENALVNLSTYNLNYNNFNGTCNTKSGSKCTIAYGINHEVTSPSVRIEVAINGNSNLNPIIVICNTSILCKVLSLSCVTGTECSNSS